MSRNSGQKGDSSALLPMTVESAMESFYKDENSCWKKMNGLLSCLIFSFCSIVMVLLNKYITTAVDINYRDNMPNIFIVWFQCVLAVVILQGGAMAGYLSLPVMEAKTVQQWLPINLLFIGMLITSFMSFIYLSVPMITIIKNLVNVLTVAGDAFFFHETASLSTILAIVLIIVGAVMSGLHDLHFHLLGYLYTLLNVACTTAYILYMRHAAAHVKLSKIEMVYYNNVLSIVVLFPLVLLSGDVAALQNPQVLTMGFLVLNLVAGVMGVSHNFASLWCVAATGATTYAVVGSLCKVPLTILGFILFDVEVTKEGLAFITLGTLGGMLYGWSKLPPSK